MTSQFPFRTLTVFQLFKVNGIADCNDLTTDSDSSSEDSMYLFNTPVDRITVTVLYAKELVIWELGLVKTKSFCYNSLTDTRENSFPNDPL